MNWWHGKSEQFILWNIVFDLQWLIWSMDGRSNNWSGSASDWNPQNLNGMWVDVLSGESNRVHEDKCNATTGMAVGIQLRKEVSRRYWSGASDPAACSAPSTDMSTSSAARFSDHGGHCHLHHCSSAMKHGHLRLVSAFETSSTHVVGNLACARPSMILQAMIIRRYLQKISGFGMKMNFQ